MSDTTDSNNSNSDYPYADIKLVVDDSTLRVGEVVRLNSGGIAMTVLDTADQLGRVLVMWSAPITDVFGFGSRQSMNRELLPVAALTRVSR